MGPDEAAAEAERKAKQDKAKGRGKYVCGKVSDTQPLTHTHTCMCAKASMTHLMLRGPCCFGAPFSSSSASAFGACHHSRSLTSLLYPIFAPLSTTGLALVW